MYDECFVTPLTLNDNNNNMNVLLLFCALLHIRAYDLKWYHLGLKKHLTRDFSKHLMSMLLRQPSRRLWRWPGGCPLWVNLLFIWLYTVYFFSVVWHIDNIFCINLFQKHLKTPDIVIGADTIVVRGGRWLTVCSILYVACFLFTFGWCFFISTDCRWHDSGEASGQARCLQNAVKVSMILHYFITLQT